MTGEAIKSFLVGLGFGVDDASLTQFNKAIASATLKVTALYTATNVMAAGIVTGISKISEGFEQMGYEYRIIAPAINKALMLRRELLKAYSLAGVNITKVIQSSVKLNFSLAKTRFAFQALYQSVASRFFDTLTRQSDLFRQKIYANLPKIQAILERVVQFIFKMIEATTALGERLWSILTRVFDFFVQLDTATSGWSTRILAVVAAWEALNLSFLATPLGFLITGLVAILALFDDFQTWKEGNQSLFDWSSFVPVIDSVSAVLTSLYGVIESIAGSVTGLLLAFYQLLHLDFSGAWNTLKVSAQGVLEVFSRLWETIKGIGGALGALGTWGSQFFGDPKVAANIQAAPQGVPSVSPVSSSVQNQNSQTNQNVHQQTNINVTGSADASAVGKSVAGEQSRVNFDLVRNMRGAAK